MKLTNAQIKYFDDKYLKLPADDRTEIHRQVDFLIERLESKIKEDTSFKVKTRSPTRSGNEVDSAQSSPSERGLLHCDTTKIPSPSPQHLPELRSRNQI